MHQELNIWTGLDIVFYGIHLNCVLLICYTLSITYLSHIILYIYYIYIYITHTQSAIVKSILLPWYFTEFQQSFAFLITRKVFNLHMTFNYIYKLFQMSPITLWYYWYISRVVYTTLIGADAKWTPCHEQTPRRLQCSHEAYCVTQIQSKIHWGDYSSGGIASHLVYLGLFFYQWCCVSCFGEFIVV